MKKCCQAINHIQNKSFCLHNICVLCIFIFSHLADAYFQSDTNEENWSNQNQQKSNDKQVL